MNIPEEIRISKYQSTVFLEGTELKELYDAIRKYWEFDEYNSGAFTASVFYNLGRVHGIREERARRKK